MLLFGTPKYNIYELLHSGLPRNGNCLAGFQAEPGRLPIVESILEGGEE